jgi:hypothetical protein
MRSLAGNHPAISVETGAQPPSGSTKSTSPCPQTCCTSATRRSHRHRGLAAGSGWPRASRAHLVELGDDPDRAARARMRSRRALRPGRGRRLRRHPRDAGRHPSRRVDQPYPDGGRSLTSRASGDTSVGAVARGAVQAHGRGWDQDGQVSGQQTRVAGKLLGYGAETRRLAGTSGQE